MEMVLVSQVQMTLIPPMWAKKIPVKTWTWKYSILFYKITVIVNKEESSV